MRLPLPSILMLAFLLSCGEAEPYEENDPDSRSGSAADTTGMNAPAEDTARADIVDARGVGIGAVILKRLDGGVTLEGALIGLPPGEHGFHIHQTGSCGPPAFESAGSHFAPVGSAHGFDVAGGPHAGDLRNLEVAADSTATVDQTNERVTLREGSGALLDADGSALIIHAGPDDYATQPSGASGTPIACGVIE